MKRLSWQVLLGIALVAMSAIGYLVHFALFGSAHHIFIYLVGDIAFVPIEVLLVTLIIHRLLSQREKQNVLKKMNMVIGAFFSEVGTGLLMLFSAFDPGAEDLVGRLADVGDWGRRQFQDAVKDLSARGFELDSGRGDLGRLRDFLAGKRPFLLRLLENPNLLEHESFTDLLWAVFHLTEELIHRGDLQALPASDHDHLAGDVKRAYRRLLRQWLAYMNHLRVDYPYLFSLAARTNPFDAEASAVVEA